MIIKNFLEQVLNESLEKVYHALNVHQLISILKNDSLELSPNVSKVETDLNDKKYYFLSTMRNKSGTYFLGISKDTKFPMKDVYVELDYDYLKSKMKSGPVDYWQANRKGSEEEERFWSNEDHISNVKSFIKKIHVLVHKDDLTDEKRKKHLVNLYWQAKFKKIPLFFYDNSQNFVVGKNPMELDFEEEMEYERPKSEYINDAEVVIKLMNDQKLTGKEVKRLKDALRYPVYREDFVTILTHGIHGGRKMTVGENRDFIKDFVDLLKKYKRKSIKEFVEKDVMDKMFERKLLYKD